MNKPKKRLFVDSNRKHGTVILNWVGTPENEFTLYGEAFHGAGRSLVQELKNDSRFGLCRLSLNSFKAVPIVYLYRHAMELYLKGIILAGADILPLRGKARVDFKKTHTLQDLLRDVEQIFEGFSWGWDFGLPHFRTLSDFRSVISELDSVQEIRYPTAKNGEAVLERDFRFNLFEFCEVLDPVYQALDNAAFGAQAQLKLEYEMRTAMQRDMDNYNPPE